MGIGRLQKTLSFEMLLLRKIRLVYIRAQRTLSSSDNMMFIQKSFIPLAQRGQNYAFSFCLNLCRKQIASVKICPNHTDKLSTLLDEFEKKLNYKSSYESQNIEALTPFIRQYIRKFHKRCINDNFLLL